MGLQDTFKAAHAVTHHTDGSVQLAQSFAFGAKPGQALEIKDPGADSTFGIGKP